MKINPMSLILGAHAPVWAPSDEGGTGGGDATDGDAAGNDTSGEAGDTQTAEIALGGDDAGDESADTTAAGDDAEKDKAPDKDDKSKTALDDDDKSDEDKAAEAKGAEVPEDGVYEFELPEGVEVSDDDKAMWSEQFKELGLSRSQAAKLVELQSKAVGDDNKAFTDRMAKQQNTHLETAKSDKDIGGDKWDESKRVANLGLKAFGGTALKNLILTSGNGNNPEVIRELMRFGEMVKDDTFETGDTHEAPVTKEKSWYSDTTPETKKG